MAWRGAVIGECMVELKRGQTGLEQTFGGDTLNVAVYLRRASEARIDYVTAVGGDDPYSKEMLEFIRANGVGCDLVQRLEGRLPGLYAIDVDDNGERRFSYWRGESAARECFSSPEGETILATLWSYDVIHLSGITLAILPEHAREKLLTALENAAARGVRISFDFNYRPSLWSGDPAPWLKRVAAISGWIFLSPEELAALGKPGAAPGSAEFDALIRELGAGQAIIRHGADPVSVYLKNGEKLDLPAPAPLRPVDTTAAGDAFAGAYVAAAMVGKSPGECVNAGHTLAAAVIMRPGAIIPPGETPLILE